MNRNRKTMLWIALAVTLPIAGCAMDDSSASEPTTSDEVQAITGPQCKIYRPYGWAVGFNSCIERLNVPPYTLLGPGEELTFFSARFIGKGEGYVTVQCDANGDGRWVEIDKVCDRVTQ